MATTVDDPTRKPGRDGRMSLGAHLAELRRRLMIAAAALIVAAVVSFFLTDPVLNLLKMPIDQVAEKRGDDAGLTALMVTTVTGPFDLRMKIAFTIAIFLTAPVWLWQLWAFIMPGLTRTEVRYTLGFTLSAVPLFFAGCATGLWVAPHIVTVMANFTPQNFQAMYDANVYFDFIFKLMLSVGIAFVIPVLLVALNLAGIMSGRDILRGWRVAVLVATIFAAITTPGADVTSMLILMGVLVLLYISAALVCLLFDRRRRKRNESLVADDGAPV